MEVGHPMCKGPKVEENAVYLEKEETKEAKSMLYGDVRACGTLHQAGHSALELKALGPSVDLQDIGPMAWYFRNGSE